MRTDHPILKALQPDDWANIPICIVDAVKILMAERLDAAEHLFDYQVKSNERDAKLLKIIQNQSFDVNKRMSDLKASHDAELAKQEKNTAV